MLRPLALTALAVGGVAAGLATAAIAFRADDTSRIDAPRVVLATNVASTSATPAPGEFPDGLAMGPDGTAPELVIVDPGVTEEPSRPSPRPSPRRVEPERPAPAAEPAPEAPPQPTQIDSEPLAFETPEPEVADASASVHIEPDDGSVRSGRRGGIAVGVDRGRRGDGGIRIGVSGVDCRPGTATLVNVRGPGLGGGFGGGYSSGF